ncbi:hypothetical protein ACWDAZ_42025, partial [Streptomyces sp. NPDC001215]
MSRRPAAVAASLLTVLALGAVGGSWTCRPFRKVLKYRADAGLASPIKETVRGSDCMDQCLMADGLRRGGPN